MMFIQTREYRFANSLELFWVDIPENDHFAPTFLTQNVQENLRAMLQTK